MVQLSLFDDTDVREFVTANCVAIASRPHLGADAKGGTTSARADAGCGGSEGEGAAPLL